MDPTGHLDLLDLVEQFCQTGQTWEKLLHVSGGSRNLAKCLWTLQHWKWINGRPTLQPLLPSDPPLLLTSGVSLEQHIIKQHSNESVLKGLGIHKNFKGTFDFHAQTMKATFDWLASRLRQSQLSPVLSRLF
jgi:hypothetical protein